ncbi:MAG: redox-regulated ATPase YchF [Candidatus Magasanikbacteria bacterium]|nr:redox-regulated ATPase YchF [Candidatus Magasanikbacteria bacterium]
MLSLGIVGLPNVGKSTLFNALTGSKQADAQNYPFCTIEPNIGVVEVPDKRLGELSAVSNSAKTIPAAIEFVDIAGLVKGASEGEGLGNKFLSNIREVDAIVHVVRAFSDSNISHVHSKVDPKEDASIINLELIMADLQTVDNSLNKTKKQAKGATLKDCKIKLNLLERLKQHLEAGKRVEKLEYSGEEVKILKELYLLTAKPMLYIVNIDDPTETNRNSIEIESGVPHVMVCAKLESELAELEKEEKQQYMADVGLTSSGLDKIIVEGYSLLNLETFFTSGEPETRAWTVKKDTKAPEAAGVIHTDFIKGFIKAEVVIWQDFIDYSGWVGAREKGKIRLEGKDYIIRDGDVCYFHIK